MSRKTRKLIWSAPLVAVLAVAGALALFVATTPNGVFAHDLPGVVGNLTAEADGTTQIDLSWDAPTEGGTPTGYRIDRSPDGNAWMSLATDHTSLTYSDMGLDRDTNYYYRVLAVNSAGTGPVSQDFQEQTDTVEPPDEVISLRATAMGQNQINLRWTASADDGGAPITKYSIHFATGDAGIPVVLTAAGAEVIDGGVIDVDVADGTSYEHKKLDHTTRYKYIVYAWNMAAGKATAESDVAAATTASLERPTAPSGVTAVQTGDRAFNLYWFAPSDNGGTVPIDYEVQAQYNGRGAYVATMDTEWRDEDTGSPDATHSVPDMTPGTTPKAITSVRYRVYAITRADVEGPVDEELKSLASRASERMTLRDLAFRMENIPGKPTFAIADAVRDPKGNVNLEWTAPPIDSDNTTDEDEAPDSIGGHRIDVSDDGLHWRSLINHTGKTAAEYHYVDPDNEDRHYRIFAWHAQTLGPAHDNSVLSMLLTDAVTPSDHVTSFTATAVSSSQIDVSWSAPQNDGKADIVLYRIDAVRKGADDDAYDDFAAADTGGMPALPTGMSSEGVLFATTKTTGYMHKKLKAGETWKYRVLVVTDTKEEEDATRILTSVATSAETRIATTPQAALPEAPEGLVAEDAKDSSLTGLEDRGVLLLWNAPNPPDGADISGYRIQRKKGAAAWETLETDTASTNTDYTDRVEPEAGEVRQYQVAALNGTKIGAYSDPVYYPAMMHEHAATEPTMVMASSDAAGELMLNWEGGANADSYLLIAVNMADTSDYKTMTVGDGAAQMGTVTGLTSGVNYLGIVVALQGTGADQTFAYGAAGVQAVQ